MYNIGVPIVEQIGSRVGADEDLYYDYEGNIIVPSDDVFQIKKGTVLKAIAVIAVTAFAVAAIRNKMATQAAGVYL
jgi:hypothetical protein